jgi:hypothetical protein
MLLVGNWNCQSAFSICNIDPVLMTVIQYFTSGFVDDVTPLLVKNTRVEPVVGYSLPVGAMSEEQAHKAQGVVVQPLLQALGFNATTPSAVVYAPLEIGGIGFRHLFAEQGTTKMRHMLQQIRLNSLVGQNLVIMMQWAQVEAGISQPILVNAKDRLPQLTEQKYITSHRKYLFISGMGLQIKAIQLPAIKRLNDKVLMDQASKMDKKHMSNKIIERINRCRNFMRVETIANVATSDGKYICRHAFECKVEVRTRSKTLWPNQPHVGIYHIYCKIVFSSCLALHPGIYHINS